MLLATFGLLITAIEHNKISSLTLMNKVIDDIGEISFNLYMWHQVIFAFSRYFIIEEDSIGTSIEAANRIGRFPVMYFKDLPNGIFFPYGNIDPWNPVGFKKRRIRIVHFKSETNVPNQ